MKKLISVGVATLLIGMTGTTLSGSQDHGGSDAKVLTPSPSMLKAH